MQYPKVLQDLIDSFSKYPGIGKKTAIRLAFYTLNSLNNDDIETFSNSLKELQVKIKKCPICGNITENDICEICENKNRDKSLIMIVENIKDLFAFEQTNEYHGLYHVLNGVIDYSKGITIEDLNFKSLLSRIDINTKEIIIATNATVEGELTAKYIKKILSDLNIKITRLAYGLPVGSDIEYIDQETILKSLVGRSDY